MASGGPNRGRIYGFGSKMDRSSLQTTSHRSTTVYPLQGTRAQQTVLTEEQVQALFAERDERDKNEAAQRAKETQEICNRYDYLFAQLFACQGRPMPVFQVIYILGCLNCNSTYLK